jgi:hypothetical protein
MTKKALYRSLNRGEYGAFPALEKAIKKHTGKWYADDGRPIAEGLRASFYNPYCRITTTSAGADDLIRDSGEAMQCKCVEALQTYKGLFDNLEVLECLTRRVRLWKDIDLFAEVYGRAEASDDDD